MSRHRAVGSIETADEGERQAFDEQLEVLRGLDNRYSEMITFLKGMRDEFATAEVWAYVIADGGLHELHHLKHRQLTLHGVVFARDARGTDIMFDPSERETDHADDVTELADLASELVSRGDPQP